MPAQFELKKSKNEKFYFNLMAANGEVVLTSQMYASKATAKKGIASVMANGGDTDSFEEKKNKSGKHFFVLKAKNHTVIGTSQSYVNSSGVKKGIQSVVKSSKAKKIIDHA